MPTPSVTPTSQVSPVILSVSRSTDIPAFYAEWFMNRLREGDDILEAAVRCASTTNRNFEGRQGRGSHTHLVSPRMAAAAAVTGHITDWRKLGKGE